jgi:hypothetical protein
MTEVEYQLLRDRLESQGIKQPGAKHLGISSVPGGGFLAITEQKKSVAGFEEQKKARTQTKIEAEFQRILQAKYPGDLLFWEAIKFRLGARCWYTPDFIRVEMEPGTQNLLTVYEVKGPRIWEDSLVKFKVATEVYHFITWEMHQRTREGWKRVL